MVFETLASKALGKFLGKYVEGLEQASNLRLFQNGETELKNLNFKVKAIEEDFLKGKLPINLKGAYAGKILLKIPFTNLVNEPVIVVVEDVYVVAGPKQEPTRKEQEEVSKIKRQDEIKALETLPTPPSSPSSQKPWEKKGFLGAFIEKIIDNIQLRIKNIHIRYESDTNIPEHPNLAIGITLESIFIQSTDPMWVPQEFVPGQHKITYKLLSLNNFGVYFNSGEEPLEFKSPSEMAELMKNLIFTAENQPKHEFLVHPISLSVKVALNKNPVPEKENPRIKASVEIDKIGVSLKESQFSDSMGVVKYMTIQDRRSKYFKLRPTQSPKENPKAWWQYCIKAAAYGSRGSSTLLTKTFIDERRKKRIAYQELYKPFLKNTISKEETEKLNRLDLDYDLEDIRQFKLMTKLQLEKEGFDWETVQRKKNQGWIGWLTSWGSKKEIVQAKKDLKKSMETVQEKKELPPNADVVKVDFSFSLNLAFVELLGNDNKIVTKVNLENVESSAKLFEKTISANARISNFFVLDDLWTENASSEEIVSVQGDNFPLLDANVHLNPFWDLDVDLIADLDIKPLKIVVNKKWIDRLVSFFKVEPIPPDVERKKKIMVPKKDHQNLEQIAESRKVIQLNASIAAPTIFIPDDPVHPQNVLVLDLGKLSITSLGQEDPDKEQMLYNIVSVQLSSLSLFTSTSMDLSSSQTVDIIKDFGLGVEIDLLSVPASTTSLPQIRVSGNIPSLDIFASSKALLQLKAIGKSIIASSSSSSSTPQTQEESLSVQEIEIAAPESDSKSEKEPSNNTILEGLFVISRFSIIVSDDERDLIDFSMKNISVGLVKKELDLDMDLKLGIFEIEDKVQGNGYLVQSKQGQDFIRVSFLQRSKESPNYEGTNAFACVNISSIDIVLNKTTIESLLKFGINLIKDEISDGQLVEEKEQHQVQKVEQTKPKKPVYVKHLVTLFKATVKLGAINISIKDEEEIAGVSLFQTALNFYQNSDQTMEVKFSLGNILVQDLRTVAKHRDIVQVDGKDLLELNFATFNPAAPSFEGFDASASIIVNSIQITVVERFVNALLQYSLSLSEVLKDLAVPAKNESNSQVETQKPTNNEVNPAKTFKFDILVKNPQVKVPSTDSDALLLLDFGRIFLGNKFKSLKEQDQKYERILLSISQMNVQTVQLNYLKLPNKIIEDVDILVKVDRYDANDKALERPCISVLAQIPAIDVNLKNEQYDFFIQLFNQNVIQPQWQAKRQHSSTSNNISPSNSEQELNGIKQEESEKTASSLTSEEQSSNKQEKGKEEKIKEEEEEEVEKKQIENLEEKQEKMPPKKFEENRKVELTANIQLKTLSIKLSEIPYVPPKKLEEVEEVGEYAHLEKCKLKLSLQASDLPKASLLGNGKVDTFLILHRVVGKSPVQWFKTEPVKGENEPIYPIFEVPAKDICHLEPIIIECWQLNNLSQNSLIGAVKTNIGDLLNNAELSLEKVDQKTFLSNALGLGTSITKVAKMPKGFKRSFSIRRSKSKTFEESPVKESPVKESPKEIVGKIKINSCDVIKPEEDVVSKAKEEEMESEEKKRRDFSFMFS